MEYILSIVGLPEYSLKRVFAPLIGFVVHVHDHFIPNHRNNYHPHILGHRALALFSALLVVVKISAIVVVSLGPVAAVFSSAINTGNVISLTNESRQQYGLGVLTENQLLDQAAQTKANDMLAKGYFSHNTPDGKTPWNFIVTTGYNYLQAGENLAVNFTEAENVETAWMNSPGHKANILNKNFEEIGIGIAQGVYQDHEAIFVVQMFGTPAGQLVALSEKPTKVQASIVPEPALIAPVVFPSKGQPQTLAGHEVKHSVPVNQPISQPVVAIVQPVPESIKVLNGNVNLNKSDVQISAQTSGEAVKVIAYFGEQAIMLSPQKDGSWSGMVSVSQLTQNNSTVRLRAYDIAGKTDELQLADFSSGTIQNYNLAGTTPASKVDVMGYNFDPSIFVNRFYLFFIAGLLTSLVLAIAIKRHVQHLPLIANASFVIILATMMWWTG